MKKTTLLTLFLAFAATLIAQQGTFTVSKTAAGKITVANANALSSSYSELILVFDGMPANTKVDFVTADRFGSVFGTAKALGTINGAVREGNTYKITLVQKQGNYVISNTISPSIPTQFYLEVDGSSYETLFKLAPIGAPNPGNPTPPVTVIPLSKKGQQYTPGNLAYDALQIKESLDKSPAEDSLVREILKHYRIKSATDLANNNYLKQSIPDIFTTVHSGDKIGTMFSSALKSAGDLNVTTLADGFAKFIVARTKQELNTAFFDQFKKILSDTNLRDVRSLFPETYKTLNVIGDQIYQYNAYLQAIRTAFDEDLSSLPENLPSIIDNHAAFFAVHKELKAMLQSSFYVAQEIQNKQHPGEIIADYPAKEFLDPINPNLAAAFETMQLVSYSLKNKEGNDYWADDNTLRQLLSKNDTVLKIYLGLLIEEAKQEGIVFNGPNNRKDSLWQILNETESAYAAYKSYLRTVVLKIRQVETGLDELESAASDSLKAEIYYDAATNGLELMQLLLTIEDLPGFDKLHLQLEAKTEKYFFLAGTTADIVIEIYRKNYMSAIFDVVQLYDSVFSKTNLETFLGSKDVSAFVPAPVKGTTGSSAPAGSPEKKADDALKALVEKEVEKSRFVSAILLKYGAFMSTVASAKTSDDVAAAIENAALPAGSARIKRESAFNIALNAYCGPYFGYEQIVGVDPSWKNALKDSGTFFNSFGLSAPIGISVSYGGWPKSGKRHSSLSAFFSVVDIGALVAFRFSDATTEVVPEIQLKNIISPGIFLSYGIPKCPVSVNFGWQMGPLLREVTAAANDYQQTYSRFSFSVCVDLPIVNFYTVPVKKF